MSDTTVPTEAAALPTPPAEDGVVGVAAAPSGGDSTFEGEFEEGLNRLVLVDMKSKRSPNPYDGGRMRDQIVWLFAIKGKEAQGAVAYYSSFSLHEKSKLPIVCDKIRRPVPEAGAPIQKQAYLGAEVDSLIEAKPGRDGKTSYPKITALIKLKD